MFLCIKSHILCVDSCLRVIVILLLLFFLSPTVFPVNLVSKVGVRDNFPILNLVHSNMQRLLIPMHM